MSEKFTPLARFQPAYPTFTFCMSQQRYVYVYPNINRIHRKYFRRMRTNQGHTLRTDWSMMTFDDRSEELCFDSTRLQTIEETREVNNFHPFEPLGYTDFDFDPVELEIPQAGPHDLQQNGLARKLLSRTRTIFANIKIKVRLILACNL